jgi:protein-S-isoprenylcysteine O-methyltransferase Ste14
MITNSQLYGTQNILFKYRYLRGVDMSIREKWIEFIYKTATGSKKVRTLLTPVGAIVFFTFLILLMVVSKITDRLLNIPEIIPSSFCSVTAIPVISLSILLAGWSIFHFLKVRGTPVPLNPPPVLVKSGPYAFVRNPMLTGVFIMLFGFGLLMNSFSMIFIFTPLFILLNVLELIFIEEPELKNAWESLIKNIKKESRCFCRDLKG